MIAAIMPGRTDEPAEPVMLRIDRLVAEELGRHLAPEFRRTFGSQQEPLAEVLQGTAR
jgi:hypothetical protein